LSDRCLDRGGSALARQRCWQPHLQQRRQRRRRHRHRSRRTPWRPGRSHPRQCHRQAVVCSCRSSGRDPLRADDDEHH
jgi:hypothetical protein